MCGLCGIVIGKKDRSQKQIDQITDMFTNLLLHSQHRGPFATGAASVGSDEQLSVVKLPVPAYRFVDSDEYRKWLGTINSNTTYLMGHTRWPTKGSIHNNQNNHPLIAEIERQGYSHLALTHNGTIKGIEKHFKQLNLPRTAQVDSELLLRIAQRHCSKDGLDIDCFIAHLPMLQGHMSMATVATSKPNEIILLKGNMPLEVRYNPKYEIIAYASEAGILRDSLIGASWASILMSAGEGIIYNSHDLSLIRRFRFEFSRSYVQRNIINHGLCML
ncbi:MAG: class II glutamine amidotransferase [Armatimonadota bacterium]